MIALLSPAKTLDFERSPSTTKHTTPEFADEAALLVEKLRAMPPQDIQNLMGVSEEIAELNAERFRGWGPHRDLDDGVQAIFAYAGEVYRGFEVDHLAAEDLYYAQNHLRILSGLYGILQPLDIIRPYRLEMGTKLATERGKDLYDFWGDSITAAIEQSLQNHHNHTVINLASKEYFGSVNPKRLQVVTPQFKEKRDGRHRIVAVYAKNARGRMARYMIENRVEEPEALKAFAEDGYRFSAELSTEFKWVFARD